MLLLPVHAGADIDDSGNNTVELIDVMSNMQLFTHKFYLSHLANNKRLLEFYTHELEETVIVMDKIASYGGYPVSNMAAPVFPAPEKCSETRRLDSDRRCA